MISLDALVSTPAFLTNGRSYAHVLSDARRLISDPNRWAQGVFARDGYGQPVKPLEQTAHCWCLLGGVARCSNDLGITPPELLRFMQEMMHFLYGQQFETLGEMNDYLNHDSVLRFLDQCIARFG